MLITIGMVARIRVKTVGFCEQFACRRAVHASLRPLPAGPVRLHFDPGAQCGGRPGHFQETAIAIWGKADEYRLDEPFMPWASRFAWFQVRKFRMYQARRGRHVVALSDEALSALAVQRTAFEATRQAATEILSSALTNWTKPTAPCWNIATAKRRRSANLPGNAAWKRPNCTSDWDASARRCWIASAAQLARREIEQP